LLGLFGFVNDSIQIGPGKTLDSSVNVETSSKLLTMLNATSRSLAKKAIGTSMDTSYRFLAKLDGEYAMEAVRDFRRSYILSLIPPSLEGVVNALSKIAVGKLVCVPLSWSEFPSYTLVKEHVERSVQIAMMDGENFSLADKFIHRPKTE
jgi:hypothetical protein